MTTAEQLFQLFAPTSNPRFHGQTIDGVKDESGKLKPRLRANGGEDCATKKIINGDRLTIDLFSRHLSGTVRVGVAPLLDDGTCCWAAIDIDGHDHVYTGFESELLEILKTAKGYCPNLIPVRSRSGGLHLWLFFDSPRDAKSVLATLRQMITDLGLPDSQNDPEKGTETRPASADPATSFEIARATTD